MYIRKEQELILVLLFPLMFLHNYSLMAQIAYVHHHNMQIGLQNIVYNYHSIGL